MKITKFVHSCLLVETPERVGIIDPGEFSLEKFDVAGLGRLDDIVVTHEHADHMSVPFIQALVDRFPQAIITTTPAAAALLKAAGIVAQVDARDGVELFSTDHEALAPLGVPPEHTGVHYAGLLTHPGDSHHFSETHDVLALPVTAPWGSMVQAVGLASQLKPKCIIPIHDWHWNEVARAQAYARLEAFFADMQIQFIKVQDGVPVEL